jgi:hypothetical protein
VLLLEAPDQQALMQTLAGNGLTTLHGAIIIGTTANQVVIKNNAYHSMAHSGPIRGMMFPVLIPGIVIVPMVMYARSTG